MCLTSASFQVAMYGVLASGGTSANASPSVTLAVINSLRVSNNFGSPDAAPRYAFRYASDALR